jgi:hypothetical protein
MRQCLAKHYAIFLGLTLLAVLFSCSDSGVDYYVPDSAALAYFPIQPGTTHNYVLTDNINDNQSLQRLAIGNPVTLGGHRSYPWQSLDPVTGQTIELGYIYPEGDAIYYFTPQSTAEKIIEAPFLAGRSWDRIDGLTDEQALAYDFSYLDTLIIGSYDKYTDQDDQGGNNGTKDYGDEGQGGFVMSTPLPLDNLNTLKIRSTTSTVALPNGDTYQNCLLIESHSGSLTNRYWYAPSVGLVMYALNIWENYPEGELVGQLADYMF